MATRPSTTQIKEKDALSQITGTGTDTLLKDILASVNSEVTPPLAMSETATPDLVLNIGSISVTNPETGKITTIPPIGGLLPSFASGTVTFPASSGGNATPSAGNALQINITSGNFLKVGIYLQSNGDLLLLAGIEGASASAASAPATISGTFAIGYVTLENVGGTIQNITNARITQYKGGGSGDGAGGFAKIFANL